MGLQGKGQGQEGLSLPKVQVTKQELDALTGAGGAQHARGASKHTADDCVGVQKLSTHDYAPRLKFRCCQQVLGSLDVKFSEQAIGGCMLF